MAYEATPLQRFFQGNPRLCPHDYRFSLDALKVACPDFIESDPFYNTAALFIDQFRYLREQLLALKILDYDSASLAKGCIGLTNQDAILAFKAQTAQPKQDTTVGPRDFISVLADRSITSASGAKLNLDESFPSMADTLQTILDALPYLARGIVNERVKGEQDGDFEGELLQFGMLSNAYRISQGDWENALWLNFRLIEDEDVLDQPEDPLSLAFRANYFRHQTYEFGLRLRRGKKMSPSASGMPSVYQATLNDVSKLPSVKALLRVFGNTKLRKSATLNDTFKTYLYIRLAAEEILSADLDVHSILQRSATLRTTFVSLVAGKCGLNHSQLSEVVDILTYKSPRQSNIWTAPIQIIEDWAVLILPALAYSNAVRFLELTSIQNSLPFGEIGRDLERTIKRQVKEILRKHPFKGAAHVLPTRTFQTSQGSEEIDLAISIGSTLFAVEIKYDHFPADPYEIYNLFRGAQEASKQVDRKAKFLAENLAALKKKGHVGQNVESVFGLVLNNTMLLSGVSLNGISFIDHEILEGYLKNSEENTLIVGGSIYSGAFRQHPFYKSREEFELSAKTYFSDPPQPKRYKAMLSKVKFSRRGGPLRKRGYDIAVYDMPTVTGVGEHA